MSSIGDDYPTHVFRAIHLPRRRRETVSDVNLTPKNVPAGEMLYDEDSNKLYAGLEDNAVVQINNGGVAGNVVVSDIGGITGASAILNIVKLSQADYDNLATKDANTLYVIDNGV